MQETAITETTHHPKRKARHHEEQRATCKANNAGVEDVAYICAAKVNIFIVMNGRGGCFFESGTPVPNLARLPFPCAG